MTTAIRSKSRVPAALALAALSVAIAGCATTGGDPRDPLEGMNRAVYSFNKTVDDNILLPVARGYRAITPDPLDRAISNFFRNLGDVVVGVNDLLQLKVTRAAEDGARVAFNSTFGLGGLVDFASGVGIDKHDEDFGQTLGYWGVSNGPYLVLPLIGPSTVRDGIGLGVDAYFFDPVLQVNDVPARNAAFLTRAVDRRADLIGTEKIVKQAALDEYAFVRDGYLQRRRNLVYDGNPPPAKE